MHTRSISPQMVRRQRGCISRPGDWEMPHISDISRKMERTMCCPTNAEAVVWERDSSQLGESCPLGTWKLDRTRVFWFIFSICGEMENDTDVCNTFEKQKFYMQVG